MKIHYTGKQEKLYPAQKEKLEAKFAKIGKLLDNNRGEKEAHVILTNERHLHNAEITVNFLDHSLVGVGADPDQFTAVTQAVEKLEKQILKTVGKRREIKKGPRKMWNKEASAVAVITKTEPMAEGPGKNGRAPRVFRVNAVAGRKPMTLEEAILEIDKDGDYFVYRDAGTDRVSVLLRRSDGNFDLIES